MYQKEHGSWNACIQQNIRSRKRKSLSLIICFTTGWQSFCIPGHPGLFLSRYLFREESHLTEHPGCTIYPQPLPDSTGGSGYWLWHLHERNGSLPRLHHRVLSCLLHIRNTVLLHIPVHPRLYLHNYTAIPCMHIYNCCGDN